MACLHLQVAYLLLQVVDCSLHLQVAYLLHLAGNLVHKGYLHNLLDLDNPQVVACLLLQVACLLLQVVDRSLHLQVEETDLLVHHFVDNLVHKGYLHNLDLE